MIRKRDDKICPTCGGASRKYDHVERVFRYGGIEMTVKCNK